MNLIRLLIRLFSIHSKTELYHKFEFVNIIFIRNENKSISIINLLDIIDAQVSYHVHKALSVTDQCPIFSVGI